MKLLIVVLLALLLQGGSSASLHAAAVPPILLGDAQSYPLAGHLEQLVDPTGKLTLTDLLASANAARFSPIAGNMNRSYTRDTVWLRFTLQRNAHFPELSYLRLAPQFLDKVQVYIQTGDNPSVPSSYRMTLVGDHVPLEEQSARSTDYLIPLLLPQTRPLTVYLRVQSTSSLVLSGAIHTSTSIISHNNLSILLQGGYLAIALVIVLINLIIYLRLHDRLFLYFALYILFLFINHVGVVGILPVLLPKQTHLVSDYLAGCGFGATICIFTPFAIRLFRLPAGSWPHRFFIATFLVGLLTIISVPLNFYGTAVSLLLITLLLTVMLLTWLSIRAVLQKEPGGMLYLVAFGLSNIGYTVQFLRLLGIIPAYWWNMNAVQIASLINMVLMTLALTERVHAAEEKALAAAQQSENRALELAGEMTSELRYKQHDLEEALDSEHLALEQKSRFLAMLSHEYRTPLAIIQANLDLLELQQSEDGQPPEPRHTSMKHAVKRLVEVMEASLKKDRLDILDSRQGADLIELTPLLDAVIDEAEGFWPSRLFVFQPSAVPLTTAGDAGQLKTALLNLLDNACKYSPPETAVTITCQPDGEMAMITVCDQGYGISPGDADFLFEKYRRGNNIHGTSGAGLGLWLVLQIAEHHGGSISLAPGPEKGTIVTIWLPLSE